jgi:hypothetical protein
MELQKRPGRVRRKRDIFVGTWNVWSLYQPGASKKLEELKRYKVDKQTYKRYDGNKLN